MTSVSASVSKFFEQRFAHDKGKPAARQGRKAVNLSAGSGPRDCLVTEVRSGKTKTLPLSFGGRSLPTRECKVLTGTHHPHKALTRGVGSGASHLPPFHQLQHRFRLLSSSIRQRTDRQSSGLSAVSVPVRAVHPFAGDCALSGESAPLIRVRPALVWVRKARRWTVSLDQY